MSKMTNQGHLLKASLDVIETMDDFRRKVNEGMKKIGENARFFRKEFCGITLTTLAKEMGISKMFLSDLERGNRHWSDDLIKNWDKSLKKLSTERNT